MFAPSVLSFCAHPPFSWVSAAGVASGPTLLREAADGASASRWKGCLSLTVFLNVFLKSVTVCVLGTELRVSILSLTLHVSTSAPLCPDYYTLIISFKARLLKSSLIFFFFSKNYFGCSRTFAFPCKTLERACQFLWKKTCWDSDLDWAEAIDPTGKLITTSTLPIHNCGLSIIQGFFKLFQQPLFFLLNHFQYTGLGQHIMLDLSQVFH